jgi:putative ABC transport system permease protein
VSVGIALGFQVGGSADRAVVLAKGAGDWGTGISREAAGTIMNAPGIAKSAAGRPEADAQMQMPLLPPAGFVQGTLQLRVFGAAGTYVHPRFHIIAGRMFHAGSQEVVVGSKLVRAFGYAVGGKIAMPQGEWPIVGEFASDGEPLEGQFVADADTVMSAARVNGFGSVIVQLRDASAYPAFAAWINGNPTLSVDVERQTDYNARRASLESALFTRISFGIGVIMGLGALFGASRILFGSVRARTREIGTLRAIGFGGLPVAASVLVESLALSLLGAALGAGIAWLIFDGRGDTVWGFRVCAQLMALGLAWGALIALLGGALPALRAARLPAVDALRASGS